MKEIFPIEMPDGSVESFEANSIDEAQGMRDRLIAQQGGAIHAFPFRMADGSIATFPGETYPEAEAAANAAADLAGESTLPQLSSLGGHLPKEVPPDLLPPGGTPLGREPTAGERFDIGGAEGIKEVAVRLGLPADRVFESPNGTQWAQFTPGVWSPLNPPGFEVGDLAQLANDPAGAGAIALQLYPPTRGVGMLGTALSGATGGALGKAASEGLEYLQGTQRQKPMEIGFDVLGAGATEGLLGGVGSLFHRSQVPLTAPGKEAQENLQGALEFSDRNREYPRGLASDLYSRTGMNVGPVHLPGPIVRSLTNQADFTTGAVTAAKTSGATQAMEQTERQFMLPPEGPGNSRAAVSDDLVNAALRANTADRSQIEALYPTYEKGMAEGVATVGEGVDAAKSRVTAQYQGPVAEAIAEEQPRFDMSPAYSKNATPGPTLTQSKMVDTGLLDADGNPIWSRIDEEIATSANPQEALSKVQKLIDTLKPEQWNYEGIKELRTRVNDIAYGRTDDAWKLAPAKALSSKLTKIIENPVNKGGAPKFVAAWQEANRLHSWAKGLEDDTAVKAMMAGDETGQVLVNFAREPANLFSPKMRELMDMAPEEAKETFRASMQLAILDSPNPVAAWDSMNVAGRQDGLNHLFANPAKRRQFERDVVGSAQWKQSPLGQIHAKREKDLIGYKTVTEKLDSPQATRRLMAGLASDDVTQVQHAVIDNAVNKAVRPLGKEGAEAVNPDVLAAEIKKLKNNGVWKQVLTPEQQKNLTQMGQYYRVFYRQLGDMGAGLENASMVADLKGAITGIVTGHPGEMGRFAGALHGFAQNRALSWYMTRPGAYLRAKKRIQATEKTPSRMPRAGVLALLAGGPAAGHALTDYTDRRARERDVKTLVPGDFRAPISAP